jgi:hypothetical protein
MAATQQWHIYKVKDQELFGPVDLEHVKLLAAEARISPQDRLSNDGQQTWVRAPQVAALQMDWLIEMPDKYLYGPTSVSTIQELLATGEIDENVVIIDTLERKSARLADWPFYQASPHTIRTSGTTLRGTQWPGEAAHVTDATLTERVNWLQKQVMELQRDLGMAEYYNEVLRAQYREATGREPI